MNARSIFKMEFYKNFRDKVWMIITGVLAILVLIMTTIDIAAIQATIGFSNVGAPSFMTILFAYLFSFFVIIGFYAYSLIYPFHLLSTDYSNKSLSLMVASGVNRSTYYFIKIIATILTYLLSLLVITIFPIIIVFGVYQAQVLTFLSEIFRMILTGNALWMTGISGIFSQLAGVVTMFFVVILTRGKFWGIFIYLGIQMVIGIFSAMLTSSFSAGMGTTMNVVSGSIVPIVISLIVLIAFGMSAFLNIRHQDL